MTLSYKQRDGLRAILYTPFDGGADQVDGRTLASLKRRGFVNSMNRITEQGILALNPDTVFAKPSPEVEEARKVQDELIDFMIKHNLPMFMRLSSDLPEEINGRALVSYVYPEWIGEFRRFLVEWPITYGGRK